MAIPGHRILVATPEIPSQMIRVFATSHSGRDQMTNSWRTTLGRGQEPC